MVQVSRGSGDRALHTLYSASLNLPGWDSVAIANEYAAGFSYDYSKVLFSGRPAGVRTYHIGLLDLKSGKARDLTAERQKTGFSAPVLCEDSPGFVLSLSPLVSKQDDVVRFNAGEGVEQGANCFYHQVATAPISNPLLITLHLDASRDRIRTGRVGSTSDRQFLFGTQSASTFTGAGSQHPQGAFVPAAGGPEIPATCLPEGSATEVLGWVGPRDVAVSVDNDDFRIVSLDGAGAVSCSGGIPPTGKSVGDLRLSYDAKAILFNVDEAAGRTKYRLPIGGTEPKQASYDDELPSDTSNFTLTRVGWR